LLTLAEHGKLLLGGGVMQYFWTVALYLGFAVAIAIFVIRFSRGGG
jgi:hypothetical protein